MTNSAPNRPPKIRIHVRRDAEGKITYHIIMAKTKTEEKHQNEGQKSTQKKRLVRYPFCFVEKNYNKKSLEGKSKTDYKRQKARPKVPRKRMPEK